MKRKLTICLEPGTVIAGSHGFLRLPRQDSTDTLTIVGDFAFMVENLQRFVDVRLLDASGVSLNQKGMTWTYEDALDTPLEVGDYVLVPFGWANGEYLAKVVKASDEPTYTGCAPIKKVACRMVGEA